MMSDYCCMLCVVNPPSSVMVMSPVTLVGSPLTLICSINLSTMLETGVQVEVVWTGPDGSSVPGGTTPSGSGTLYKSELTLNSSSASNAGINYTCTASLTTSTLPSLISSSNISDSGTISLQSKLIFQLLVLLRINFDMGDLLVVASVLYLPCEIEESKHDLHEPTD